jgi:hypothetical protein
LRPGTVPEAGWLEAVNTFMQTDADAASFRRPGSEGLLTRLFPPRIHPEQGLLIRNRAYVSVGGHAASEDAEATLLSRLGRIHLLAASARSPIT